MAEFKFEMEQEDDKVITDLMFKIIKRLDKENKSPEIINYILSFLFTHLTWWFIYFSHLTKIDREDFIVRLDRTLNDFKHNTIKTFDKKNDTCI